MIQLSSLTEVVLRVTRAIRNVFQLDGDLEESDVESLHNELVECVETVNERLRRCDGLLRKGLRVEALQEVEAPPNLLEIVAELDIPEWDAWADYVRQFRIPPQPALLLDVAAALNGAYAEAESLESVLRQHRLHALARSPLRARLKVLRNLAIKDPSNAIWQEDIRAYEAARLQEVQVEFRGFSDRKDVTGLAELRSELETQGWLVQPPDVLRDKVRTAHEQFKREHARAGLEKIEVELNAAFSDFDLQAATLAQDEWKRFNAIAQLPEADPLARRVSAAFDWMKQEAERERQQQEHQRAIAVLEKALDDEHCTKLELRRLHNALERSEESIPDRLQRRYSERIKGIETAETRRGRLVMVAAVTAVLVLGGIVVAVLTTLHRHGRIQDAGDGMAQMLEKKKLAEAEKSFQGLPEFIQDSPRLQQLHVDLLSQLKEEQARKERLQAKEERIALLIGQGTFKSFREAREEILEASAISEEDGITRNDEKTRLTKLEQRLGLARSNLQENADSDFYGDVEELSALAKQPRKLGRDELERGLAQARELDRRRNVTENAKKVLAPVIKNLEGELRARDIEEQLAQSLRNVIQLNGADNPKLYADALRHYAETAPSGRRQRDFRTVADRELGFIEHVKQWNELARSWNSLRFEPPSRLADRGLPLIARMESEFKDFPGAREPLELKTFLESVQVRGNASGESVERKIQSTLRAFQEPEMKYLETRVGNRRYYFIEGARQDPSGKRIAVSVLTSTQDVTRIENKVWNLLKLKKFSNGKYYAEVPQNTLVDQALSQLAQNESFEQRVCRILNVIYINPSVDPILKCYMLQLVVDLGKSGSPVLAQALLSLEKTLSKQPKLHQVNWIHPEDADGVRNAVRKTLSQILEDPVVIYKRRVKPELTRLENLKNRRLPQFAWTGSLLLEGKDWRYRAAQISSGNGQLYVHVEGEQVLTRIGELKSGTASLDAAQAKHFAEGRPVWMRETD